MAARIQISGFMNSGTPILGNYCERLNSNCVYPRRQGLFSDPVLDVWCVNYSFFRIDGVSVAGCPANFDVIDSDSGLRVYSNIFARICCGLIPELGIVSLKAAVRFLLLAQLPVYPFSVPENCTRLYKNFGYIEDIYAPFTLWRDSPDPGEYSCICEAPPTVTMELIP